MKTLYTLFLLVILAPIIAQRNSGVKFGLTTSWVSTAKSSDQYFTSNNKISPLSSFHIGYSWNIPLITKWSVQTDFLLCKKGYKQEQTNPEYINYNSYTVPTHDHLYLSLPIIVTYMVIPRFFGEIGVETSVSNSATKLWDFGVVAGMGYNTKYVDISCRYILGLSTINQEGYNEKNRSIQLSLTIPIFKHLKRK